MRRELVVVGGLVGGAVIVSVVATVLGVLIVGEVIA